MKSIFPIFLICILTGLTQGCVGGPDSYDFATVTGKRAVHERHKEIAPNRFYIEELGSGFSSHEDMEILFRIKAQKLCPTGIKSFSMNRGRRYPDAKLPEVILKGCVSGGFCNATQANFPLVFGTAECHSASKSSIEEKVPAPSSASRQSLTGRSTGTSMLRIAAR